MKKCYCYRCGGEMEANPEIFNLFNMGKRSYQEMFNFLVCDNCLDWYRTGGVNNGTVEYGILVNKYDKDGINLFDKFKNEKKAK